MELDKQNKGAHCRTLTSHAFVCDLIVDNVRLQEHLSLDPERMYMRICSRGREEELEERTHTRICTREKER